MFPDDIKQHISNHFAPFSLQKDLLATIDTVILSAGSICVNMKPLQPLHNLGRTRTKGELALGDVETLVVSCNKVFSATNEC